MHARADTAKKVELVILSLFTIWLALTVISPYTIPADSTGDLSGTVGKVENGGVFESMNPVARVVYTLGDAYCHQKSERSYTLNGNQMPFCARDEGIFLGLVIGMVVATVTRYEISVKLLVLGIVPMAIDGGLQILTGYESSNPTRIVTGVLAGAAIALLISLFAREIGRGGRTGSEEGGQDRQDGPVRTK